MEREERLLEEHTAAVREWVRLPFILRDHINKYDGKPRELPLPAESGDERADMTSWTRLLARAHGAFNIPKHVELELVVATRHTLIGAVADEESLANVNQQLLFLGAKSLRGITKVEVRVERRSRVISPRLLPPLALGACGTISHEERDALSTRLKQLVYPDKHSAGPSQAPSNQRARARTHFCSARARRCLVSRM